MTTETVEDIKALGEAAHKASRELARLSAEDKNQVLLNLAFDKMVKLVLLN